MIEGIETFGRYYGCYMGYVTKNEDPNGMNRLKVCVPEVNGIILWALPKGQHGGFNSGFKYLSPKIGDVVWISFEGGDISKPIWEYYGWAFKEIPVELDDPNVLGIVTPNGNVITIDESDNHLDIYIKGDAAIHTESTLDISSSSLVRVNSGNNLGVINIQPLTDKLNQLVQEIESLKSTFNNHTHMGVLPGPAATATPLIPHNETFSQFNKDDYEDTKFTH